MLRRLAIRDIVLIDQLALDFGPGLTVLTGETGAGKSILLDALGLALGARADSGLVRPGAAAATVTAAFDLPAAHPAWARLADADIPRDGELILRRVVGADGRSRATINDAPASIGLLRALGDLLIEIHGQFETHGLLDAATHLGALDDFADVGGARRALGELHRAWREARKAEDDARARAARADEERAFLENALGELDALDPKPGEAGELTAKRALHAQGAKLAEALNAAASELSAGKGVEPALRAAQRALQRVAASAGGGLDAAIKALDQAASASLDAQAAVEDAGAALDLEPGALERIEDRLFALKAVARKHRIEAEDLAALRERTRAQLTELSDGGTSLKRLAAATIAARDAYARAAEALSAARAAAAAKLDRALAKELPPLKLDKAKFRTRIDRLPDDDWNADGIDRVAFEVATIPGAPPGPIAKIASGGELARFMLALRVVLARAQGPATLVFDEVDSGIGGAVADAVGERLARLARDVQVLVVTHSPQVAARGSAHFRVIKRKAGAGLATDVGVLDARERREEIARMLAGAQVTEAARAAADALIKAAS